MTGSHSGLAIELAVEAGAWPEEGTLYALAERASRAMVEETTADLSGRGLFLLFTDDAHVAELNAKWRGQPKPTNVLSFPASIGPGPVAPGEPAPIGDIVFGFETVDREAKESDLTLGDHITHLLVHGLLHLRGYDHEDDAAADVMERLEAAILARLGIADPYAGSDPEHTKTAGRIGS